VTVALGRARWFVEVECSELLSSRLFYAYHMNTYAPESEALAIESPTAEPRRRVKQEVTHGAKLLCIDDRKIRRHYTPGPPVRGRVYCVRELYEENGVSGVLLVGIMGPKNATGLECGFLLSRFRWVHD